MTTRAEEIIANNLVFTTALTTEEEKVEQAAHILSALLLEYNIERRDGSEAIVHAEVTQLMSVSVNGTKFAVKDVLTDALSSFMYDVASSMSTLQNHGMTSAARRMHLAGQAADHVFESVVSDEVILVDPHGEGGARHDSLEGT